MRRDAAENLPNDRRKRRNVDGHRSIVRRSIPWAANVDRGVRTLRSLDNVDWVVDIIAMVGKQDAPLGDIPVIRVTRIGQVVETEHVNVDRRISRVVPDAVG